MTLLNYGGLSGLIGFGFGLQSLWEPDQIPGGEFWVDPIDGSTVTQSGGAVSSLTSKFGGFNFTQTTPAKRPAISDGSLVFTGNEWLDGVNLGNMGPEETVAVVFTPNFSVTGDILGSVTSSAYALRLRDSYNTLDWTVMGFTDGVDAIRTVNYNNPLGNKTILIGRRSLNLNRIEVNKNGSLLKFTTHTSSATVQNIPKIGARANNIDTFGGQIHEVIKFNNYISDTDKLKLEGYLAHKHGLENELPVGHLYRLSPPPTDPDPLPIPAVNQPPTVSLVSIEDITPPPVEVPWSFSDIPSTVFWYDPDEDSIGSVSVLQNKISGGPSPTTINSTSSVINDGVYKTLDINADSFLFTTEPLFRSAFIFVDVVSSTPSISSIAPLFGRIDNTQHVWMRTDRTDYTVSLDGSVNNTGSLVINGGVKFSGGNINAGLNFPTPTGKYILYLEADNAWSLSHFAGFDSGGGLLPANMNVLEVAVFNTPLTNIEIDQGFGYLAHSRGEQALLPTNHPYRNEAP